jgi:TrwC relaxase
MLSSAALATAGGATGLVKAIKGDLAEAITDYSRALDIDPKADGYLRALGEKTIGQRLSSRRCERAGTSRPCTDPSSPSRLTELGYQIERGKSGEPTIVGYSPEYLEASSPRRTQIEERMAALKRSGAAAAQVAAHQTRGKKVQLTPERGQTAAPGNGDQVRQSSSLIVQGLPTATG